MGRPVPRWTTRERNDLMLAISTYGIDWLRRKVGGRSRRAVYSRIEAIVGEGGLTRGSYTIREVIELTGYNREQLERAGRALQQRWARTSRHGSFMISEDQIEQLSTWLRKDYWCMRLRLYGCLRCGTGRQPPRSFGLCTRCYYRGRRQALGLGLPFVAAKLHARVVALKARCAEADREFLELLEARLQHRWAPSEGDLERLARLGNLRVAL